MRAKRVKINILKEKIANFCARNHIRPLSLFGSVVRDDFNPESDVDALVEFYPAHTPGLAFFAMRRELSKKQSLPVKIKEPKPK
jgi:uncharacterized protein